jgi:hypothetical protein
MIVMYLTAVLSIYLFIFMPNYSLQCHVLNNIQSLILQCSERPIFCTLQCDMPNHILCIFHYESRYTLFCSDILTVYQVL